MQSNIPPPEPQSPAIQYRSRRGRTPRTRRVLHVIAVGVVGLYLLTVLLFSIAAAFASGPLVGLRSLAAAVLLPFCVFYFALLAKPRVPANVSRAPLVNNFIIFTLWTVLKLSLLASLQPLWFPLTELLYSFTISAMLWRYSVGRSLSGLAACCYGVLCGLLAFIALFGWPY